MTDNTPRPRVGALWWSELYTDYFDLDFYNTFSGECCTVRGFYNHLKAIITKQHDRDKKTYSFDINIHRLVNELEDDRATAEKIVEWSEKLLELGLLTDYEVIETQDDKPFKLRFSKVQMLKYFDTYTKQVHRQDDWLVSFRQWLEEQGVSNSVSDSTQDECIEYAKVKKFGKKKSRDNLEPINKFDTWIKVFEESLKTPKGKVKDNKLKDIRPFKSSNGSNNTNGFIADEHCQLDQEEILQRQSLRH